MSSVAKRLVASLATVGAASLIMALGTAFGLIDWILALMIMAVGSFLLLLPKLAKRSLSSILMPSIAPRQKFAHSAGGLLIFSLGMLYGKSTTVVFISACTATYMTYEAVRWLYVREPFYISRVMDSLGSLEEDLGKPYPSPIYAFMGLWIAYAIFPPEAASVSAIVLCVGDGVAPVAGRMMGLMRNPLNPKKTVGGSLVGFLAALAVCLTFARPLVALAGCATGMLVECLPLGVDDNFSIPVAAVVGAALLGRA